MSNIQEAFSEQMSVSRSFKAMGEKRGLIRAIKLHSREHYKTLVSSAMLTRQSISTAQLRRVNTLPGCP